MRPGIALHYRALTDVARDIRERRISPVEVTDELLKRIEKWDPTLGSFTTLTAELARAQARQAQEEMDAGKYRSPLHGIPVAVKDNCFTRGVVTTAGMAIRRNSVPQYDATVVTRLAQAGAVLLGKLHMTEGAFFDHHPDMPAPINPWGQQLWSGVSSSGPGVATAAGFCFASLGSDTGASIRFPSACNALTGIKPTWGRVSRHGVFPLAPTFDVVGPMARSAADVAAVLDSIAGYDSQDPTTLTEPVPAYLESLRGVAGARGLRIGVDRELLASVTPVLADAIDVAAGEFRKLGAEIRSIVYPSTTELVSHLGSLCAIEMAAVHEATFPLQPQCYGPTIAAELQRVAQISPVDIAKGILERERFRASLNQLLTEVDAVLLPVLSMETPTLQELAALGKDIFNFVRFNMPINAAGGPAISIPCGFTAEGRPLGMQLVGRHCSETTLLQAAHAYQQVTDWHLRHPL